MKVNIGQLDINKLAYPNASIKQRLDDHHVLKVFRLPNCTSKLRSVEYFNMLVREAGNKRNTSIVLDWSRPNRYVSKA